MLNSKFLCIGLVSAILMTSFSTSSVEAAKVYTWKDASGVTHYSDKPFPRVKNSKTLQIKAARPKAEGVNNEVSEDSSTVKQELFDPADTKRLKTECSKARNNLVILASGKKIQRTNANGEQIALDEAGVRAEVQKSQSFISANCRSAVSSSNTVSGNRNSNSLKRSKVVEESVSDDQL